MVDGGRIDRTYRHNDEWAVSATWSGGRWSPDSDTVVRIFRDRLMLGLWRVTAVDVLSSINSDAVVHLRPIRGEHAIREGDVAVIGDGVYSIVRVAQAELESDRSLAVEVGQHHLHGVAEFLDGRLHQLLIFHAPETAIERETVLPIWWRGRRYEARLAAQNGAAVFDYPIEIRLSGEHVTLGHVIRVLSPIRSFVLDAGQEMLFQSQRPGSGKRRSAVYKYFEPLFQAEPGSVRLFIHAARPKQVQLLVEPQEPLRMLGSVLVAAVEGDVRGVTAPLIDRVFSVDALLKRVKHLADTARRFGPFVLRTPDYPEGVEVGRAAASVLDNSIRSLIPRTVHRVGMLYALDLFRNWMRVMAEEAGEWKDWTLKYPDEIAKAVRGKVPREVAVTFQTRARPDATRGTGVLTHLRELETHTASE